MSNLNNNYTASVPQGNQQVNNTQQPIENNFLDIYQLMGVNHVNFNVADIFGNHTFLSLFNQSSDPSTSSTEMALYSKPVANDENSYELFCRYPNNGQVTQLTSNSSSGSTGSTGGGQFNYFQGTSTGYGGWGNGTYQYLSNGLLIMNWAGVNNANLTPSPFNMDIPNGNGAPTFTQTPFVLMITGTYGATINYSVGNYAAIPQSPTYAKVYYTGIASQVGASAFIAIGI